MLMDHANNPNFIASYSKKDRIRKPCNKNMPRISQDADINLRLDGNTFKA